MISRSLLLHYTGLPTSWDESNKIALNSAIESRLVKALTTIKSSSKGGLVYVQGDGAIVLDVLEELGVTLNQIKGINFPQYFDDKFADTKKYLEVIPKRYTFIYDVGLESALKKDFSSQLLKKLIQTITNENCWCFIISDDSKSSFEKNYKVPVSNSVALPKKAEINLF